MAVRAGCCSVKQVRTAEFGGLLCHAFRLNQVKVGKLRVWPGGLAITRSFGDYSAKLEAFGGIQDSVLCEYDELRTVTVDPDKHRCTVPDPFLLSIML